MNSYETEIPTEVLTFIAGLPPHTRVQMSRRLGLLEAAGPLLSLPYCRPLGGGLYELRTTGSNAQRLYYGFIGRLAVIVHHGGKGGKTAQNQDIAAARSLLASRVARGLRGTDAAR